MPAIASFYGIIVYMYRNDATRHKLPHIHVYYSGKKAVLAVADGRVLKGSLGPAKLRMVQTWMDIHRKELLANWHLACENQEVFKIDPLR